MQRSLAKASHGIAFRRLVIIYSKLLSFYLLHYKCNVFLPVKYKLFLFLWNFWRLSANE